MPPEPTPPRPWVHPRDLLLAHDVRRLCGIAPESRHTIIRWRAKYGFPEPIRSIKVGRGRKAQHVEIWDRRDVRQWLKEHPPVSNLIEPGGE